MPKSPKRAKKRFIIIREPKYTKRFSVKKESPIDKLLAALSPPKKVKKERGVVKKVEEKVEVKGKDITIGKLLPVIILLLFIGFGYWQYMEFTKLLKSAAGTTSRAAVTNSILVSPISSYITDYGKWTNPSKAVIFNINSKDAVDVSYGALNKQYYGAVYVLSTSKLRNVVEGLDGFIEKAKASHLLVQRIYSPHQLLNLPKKSIVIIISEFFPSEVAPYISTLLSREVHIVIVGASPDYQEESGFFKSAMGFWSNYGIAFSAYGGSAKPLKAKTVKYKVVGGKTVTTDGLVGPVTYLRDIHIDKKRTYPGDFVFLTGSVSQDFNRYWKSSSDFSADLYSVTTSLINKWLSGHSSYKGIKGAASLAYGTSSGTGDAFIFTKTSQKGKPIAYMFGYARKDYPGKALFHDVSPIYPYYISGQASLIEFEASPTEPDRFTKVLLSVFDSSSKEVDSLPVNKGSLIPAGVPMEVEYFNKELKEGSYTFVFTDANSGEIFARSFLEMGKPTVRAKVDFTKARFGFTFLVNGKPYPVRSVTIKYKDWHATYNNIDHVVVDLSDLFGGAVPSGTYEFEVYIAGVEKPYKIKFTKADTVGIKRLLSPTNIIMILLAGGFYIAGAILKRREESPYSIDVPDFAPVEYETIEITEEQLLNAFDVVNDYYKWKLTPLTLDDIKKGIQMVLMRKDLVLNDFNVELVLENLVKEGLILRVDKFYLKKEWTEKGFSAEQLIMFRELRDTAIESAIPFKPLSKALPHTKLTLPWQQFWVYLYNPLQRESIIKHIVRNYSPKEDIVQVILFYDDFEKESFDLVLSDGRKITSLIKGYIDNEFVFIFTLKEFMKKLKQLKS